jgi:hypothetical protein
VRQAGWHLAAAGYAVEEAAPDEHRTQEPVIKKLALPF